MNLLEQLFAPLEKLINEHGSAAILRERVALLKAQLTEHESRQQQLAAEYEQMKTRALDAEHRARVAEAELQALKSGQHNGPCCDACGSPNVRRTGGRKSPGPFGDLGLREALFTCGACGHVSAIELPMG